MDHHVHTAGLSIVIFAATLVVLNFLTRTVAAKHPDNPAFQGLAYVL